MPSFEIMEVTGGFILRIWDNHVCSEEIFTTENRLLKRVKEYLAGSSVSEGEDE